MWAEEVIAELTSLASASSPCEIEKCRTEILGGADNPALTALVDALSKRSMQVWELERLATEDSLTGLANRRSFSSSLRREMSRRQRGRGPAILLLDLDGLKSINDELGHGAGDEAIRQVAKSCTDSVRGGDLVARLGGDEFAILLPDTNVYGGEVVATRVRAAIEACQVQGESLKVSVGVAVVGPDGSDHESVVAVADARMYEDKRQRKGRLRLAA